VLVLIFPDFRATADLLLFFYIPSLFFQDKRCPVISKICRGYRMTQAAIQRLTPLRTTLYAPLPRSSWISRSRLVDRVEEGFSRKLTLISAPAGFSKTTLLADWANNHDIPAAWFSVDKGDNDPLHFLAHGTLGLQTLEGGIGKAALTILQSPQPPPTESILANRIKDLARLATDCALAVDVFHWIDARPIHDMTAFLPLRLI
jgi:LuxR family maltose regulon positive regulatory protein